MVAELFRLINQKIVVHFICLITRNRIITFCAIKNQKPVVALLSFSRWIKLLLLIGGELSKRLVFKLTGRTVRFAIPRIVPPGVALSARDFGKIHGYFPAVCNVTEVTQEEVGERKTGYKFKENQPYVYGLCIPYICIPYI